jgi:hypothetical protein
MHKTKEGAKKISEKTKENAFSEIIEEYCDFSMGKISKK